MEDLCSYDQLTVGLVAQLVKHSNNDSRVTGLIPVFGKC